LLVAQKVAESLVAKYMRIALATLRKLDDSFGYAVVSVYAPPQSRLTVARAISNATPMIRVVSGSNFWSPRNGVIGMMPIRSPCRLLQMMLGRGSTAIPASDSVTPVTFWSYRQKL
jgi:hypothetical protein